GRADDDAGRAALAAELKGHVKARLSKHKYPRGGAVVGDVAKKDRGKVDRKALREREASGKNPKSEERPGRISASRRPTACERFKTKARRSSRSCRSARSSRTGRICPSQRTRSSVGERPRSRPSACVRAASPRSSAPQCRTASRVSPKGSQAPY